MIFGGFMIVDFAKSNTRLNLMKAFAGESQARERYTIAASFASKQKMQVVSKLFLEIADQEKEHGEIFYEFLKPFSGENIAFSADYPVDVFDSVLEHLKKASQNEFDEFDNIYADFGRIAAEEGFSDIAQKFLGIAKIEKTHCEKFKSMANLIENDELFRSKSGRGKWVCMKCGNVYEGNQVPDRCPVCGHDRGFFVKSTICF